MCAARAGNKSSYSMDDLLPSVKEELNLVNNYMKEKAKEHFNQHIKKMPNLKIHGSTISLEEELEEGYVYEMAFDGNDAEAEAIEKETGFSFLGVSTNAYSEERKCIISGRPTSNRVFLAKTY